MKNPRTKKIFKIIKKFTLKVYRVLKTQQHKEPIQNWLEDLNNHVFREDKQVINKQDKWLNVIKRAGM